MRGLSRLHREEGGVAMVVAMMVVFVVVLLSIVILDLSIHNVDQAAYDRKRVTSVAASEGGIDHAWNLVQYTKPENLPWGTVTGTLGSAPGPATFEAQYTWYDSTGAVMTVEPDQTHIPSAVLVRSTGETNGGVPRTMEAYMTLTPTYGGFGAAILANTGFSLANNFTLNGNQGNDADIYVLNGDFTAANSSDTYGTVYVPNGLATVSNGGHIHGDVWANGSVTMQNGGRIDGKAVSSTSSIGLSNNSSVGGDATAGTTISTVNNSTIGGTRYPNSPQGPPPTKTFPKMCQVAISGVCTALPWSGYTVHTYTGGSACTSARTFLTSGTLTGDHLVWIDAVCNLSIANNTNVSFTGNLAIVTQGSITMTNNTTWNGASGRSLFFIVNYRTIFPASCSSSYNITVSNNSRFNGANALFYTPCAASMSNNTDFKGQIMAGSLSIANNFSMSSSPVLVPGVSDVQGFEESIVYIREVLS